VSGREEFSLAEESPRISAPPWQPRMGWGSGRPVSEPGAAARAWLKRSFVHINARAARPGCALRGDSLFPGCNELSCFLI